MSSCVKDKPAQVEYTYDYQDGPKAYIIHEGNYGSGNSSLSYKHLEQDILNDFIYRTANQGEILGDIFQSMLIDDEDMYLSINNSNQIIICDRKSMMKKYVIPLFSPRYMYLVTPYKMYITSLYVPYIYVVNPSNYTVVDTLIMPHNNIEKLYVDGDRVYVSSWDTAHQNIYVIDSKDDILVDSIHINAAASNDLLMDKNGLLWVFSGNADQGVPYKITVIDPLTKAIQNQWTSSATTEWIKPCMDSNQENLFWIALDYGVSSEGMGVYRMGVEDVTMPVTAFIPAQRWQYYYGLAWNPIDQEIWVGDPKSFSEKSKIYIYSPEGAVKDSFVTQLGVGGFYFSTR